MTKRVIVHFLWLTRGEVVSTGHANSHVCSCAGVGELCSLMPELSRLSVAGALDWLFGTSFAFLSAWSVVYEAQETRTQSDSSLTSESLGSSLGPESSES